MTDQNAPSPQQKLAAPPEITALVDRFAEQLHAYRAGKYNETQLRRDFLDPLFEALGWDMTNRKGYSERFREVVHESSVEVEGGAKAADHNSRPIVDPGDGLAQRRYAFINHQVAPVMCGNRTFIRCSHKM